ncbi:MFS_1_like domain-containing protein [Caerostris extrusa]|uniref:MFS_1_like domain-containing protein n=1 Tax=Caerostris extrusa TaxID=172846 RepID=A0AAV4VWR3_CAEEX|nr:MFS_1_like domain-containing protein [Caerostris extrusa]
MASGTAGQKPDLGKDGGEKAAESFWHIDKEMLRFKIHFLLHSGGLVAAIPFVSLFAKEKLGLAASSLGAVLTAQMFLYIFTKPLIGYIADYFNRLKAIICVLTLITISCYFSLLALPKIKREEAFNSFVSFSSNATYLKREFVKINENETDVLFNADSSQLSITHQLELEDKKFLLCSFKTDLCFHVYTRYMLMNETENNVGYYIQVQVDKEEEFVTFCNGNNSFDLCACHGPSPCHDSSSECMSLFCSDVLTTKETNSNESLFMCSTSTQKLDTIVVSCSAQNITEDHAMESQRTFSDFHTFQFWVFAFLLSVSSISENANCTLSDTACCESVQKSKADFGKQRLWGSVGWGDSQPSGVG